MNEKSLKDIYEMYFDLFETIDEMAVEEKLFYRDEFEEWATEYLFKYKNIINYENIDENEFLKENKRHIENAIKEEIEGWTADE